MVKWLHVNHICGHEQFHKYDDRKYKDRKQINNYRSWLAEQECSECKANKVQEDGVEAGFAELKGSPGAIAYAGQCRQKILDAIFAYIYQGYDSLLSDPAFIASDEGKEFLSKFDPYKEKVGSITSCSVLIEMSQWPLEEMFSYLNRDESDA